MAYQINNRRSIVFVASIFIFCLTQAQNKIDGFGINPKMGLLYGNGNNDGVIAGLEVNVLKKNFIYSFAYYDAEVITLSNSTPEKRYNQLDLTFGKYVDKNYFRFQYQAGLGAFWGFNQGELISEGSGFFPDNTYEEVPFFTIGVPLKLGFKVIPLKFLSVGLDLQANINRENSIVMPMLSIEIGRIRN